MNMSTRESVFEELTLLLSKEFSVPIEIVGEDSVIEDDFGISGDDAYDLIEVLRKRFKLKIDDGVLAKYFSPEVSLISLNAPPPTQKLTVRQLVESIISGELA